MQKHQKLLGILLSLALVLSLLPGVGLYALADEVALYPLWVGGVQVSAENAGDVFGDGKVCFRPAEGEEPAILALNNYSYTGEGMLFETENGLVSAALFYNGDVPLEIRLTGENTLIQTCETTVRTAASIFSYGEDVDVAIVGTEEAASLTAASGRATTYSNTLVIGGSLRFANLKADLTSGECSKESEAVYCLGVLQVSGCELHAVAGNGDSEDAGFSIGLIGNGGIEIDDSMVTIQSGDNVKSSYGMDSYGDVTILDSTTEAVTGDGSEFCIGILLDGSLQIEGSEVLFDTTAESTLGSYSIECRGGDARIQDSTVTVKSAGGDYNYAISISEGRGLDIIDSAVNVQSDFAICNSVGISVEGNITISGTSDVTAVVSGTPVTGEDQTYSCGIECENLTISGIGTKVRAVAGAGDTSHGLVANETLTIADEVEYVEAVSQGHAIYGLVKNGLEGAGWVDFEGAGEGEVIPVSEEGAELPGYKKIVFRGAHPYQVWIGGERVTSENLAGEGWSFTPAAGEEPAVIELNNYSYTGKGCAVVVGGKVVNSAIFYNEEAPVELRLVGENTLVLEDSEELPYNTIALFLRTADAVILGEDGASLSAICGTGEIVSAAVAGKGYLRIEGVTLDATNTESKSFSYAVYAGKDLTIVSSEVRAQTGKADRGSYAIYAINGSIVIDDCKIEATSGSANHSIAIDGGDQTVTIINSKVTATAADAMNSSHAIESYKSRVEIRGSTVKAKAGNAPFRADAVYAGYSISISDSEVEAVGGTANYSMALVVFTEGVSITNSKVYAEGGLAQAQSAGIYVETDVTISGNSTVELIGKQATSEQGASGGILAFGSVTVDNSELTAASGQAFESYGICGHDFIDGAGCSVIIRGSTVKAASAGGTYSYGIYTGTLEIAADVGTVEAAGQCGAVYGTVKNALEGLGWTELAEGGESNVIPVNEEGAELPDYKRVLFQNQVVNPFVDVAEDAYYFDAVLWAVGSDPQITNGTSATTFSPDNTCTRAQVVTFLWRANGCPEPTATELPFTDVPTDAYYYKAVLWAVENGITNGTSATTFGPDSGCTRAQVVTFLWRAEGKPEPANTDNPFADVTAGAYYETAVLWAVEQGITNGTSATSFSPETTCTRGQTVTFLYRNR